MAKPRKFQEVVGKKGAKGKGEASERHNRARGRGNRSQGKGGTLVIGIRTPANRDRNHRESTAKKKTTRGLKIKKLPLSRDWKGKPV